MRRPDFLQGTAFRMAAVHAALFSISVLVLFSFVYWATARAIEDQLENEIRAELSALATEAAAEGTADLVDTIGRRLDGDLSGAYLLLQRADGTRIAGNLPPAVARDGWIDIRPPDDPVGKRPTEHVVHAKGRVLDDGSFLVVGRDIQPLRQLQQIIVHGFLTCGVATILVALCIGILTSSRVLRRVRAISLASGEIMRGDLGRRLAVGRRGDEFDELAGRVNAMLDQIQRLIVDLQQVSNDIAHDLRTPLTRLRQSLELALADDSGESAAGKNEIAKAIAEADRLLDTFTAMLRIAQIDSGSRRAGFRTFDLSALLEGLAETYGPVAEDGGRRIRPRVTRDVGVVGDAELLTQMFANLIENAIKHTPPGSTIRIELTKAKRHALATVADDGPGIPPSLRERACKRFARLDASRTTPGSGLGLSLVAAIADLHGLALEFDDEKPGLRVGLRFPTVRADVAADAQMPAGSRTSVGGAARGQNLPFPTVQQDGRSS